MPTMYEALNANEQDLGGWRQVYPDTLRIYFMWWENRRGEAMAAGRRLLAQHPDDDGRLLLATMLFQEKQAPEAISLLETLADHDGQSYVSGQLLLLRAARMSGNSAAGLRAWDRLTALKLPKEVTWPFMGDLHALQAP